jgi:hypothetical protein
MCYEFFWSVTITFHITSEIRIFQDQLCSGNSFEFCVKCWREFFFRYLCVCITTKSYFLSLDLAYILFFCRILSHSHLITVTMLCFRGLTLLVGWLAFFAAFFPVHFLLKGQKMRSKIERKLVEMMCSVFVASWTGVIKYHGPRPSTRPHQVTNFLSLRTHVK